MATISGKVHRKRTMRKLYVTYVEMSVFEEVSQLQSPVKKEVDTVPNTSQHRVEVLALNIIGVSSVIDYVDCYETDLQ